MSLFRSEIEQERSGRWLGSVRIAQSVPTWIVALSAATLAGALVTYVVFGSYAKKARIVGVLVSRGGEVNIVATSAGYVSELKVKEGQWVKKGDVIMVLDTDRKASVGGDTATATAFVDRNIKVRHTALLSERESKQNQALLRRQVTQDRILAIDAELQKLDDEISLQKRRRDLAVKSVKRYEDLVRAKFVSLAQVQQQEESLLEQEARLQSLERTKLQLQSDRATKESDLKQIAAQSQTELAAIHRELAALGQEATENAVRRNTVVVSPRAGMVSAMAIGVGQFVSTGQNLAALQPEGAPLEAHLFAASRTAGFVKEGQQVFVRYAAYPYQKFGMYSGKVASVSNSAFAPNELPPSFQILFGRTANPEALYRITVSLDRQFVTAYGRQQMLKPGMALEAGIVQDRRRIVEWMLEPLFAFAARV